MKSNRHNRSLTPIVPPKAVALVAGAALALAGGAPAAAARPESRGRAVVSTHESETPVTALTKVIKDLEKGGSVAVTARKIALAGASTGIAKGRPIEFADGDQSYLAYTQGSQPNFKISPRATAESMAIVDLQLPGDVGIGPPLAQAHLNAHHVLVDTVTHTPVGFATGGGDGNPTVHS